MSRAVLAPVAGVVAVLLCCGAWSLLGGAIAGWTIGKVVGVSAGALAAAIAAAAFAVALIRRRRTRA